MPYCTCVPLWIVIKIPRSVYFQFLVRKVARASLRTTVTFLFSLSELETRNKKPYESALLFPPIAFNSHPCFLLCLCLCVVCCIASLLEFFCSLSLSSSRHAFSPPTVYFVLSLAFSPVSLYVIFLYIFCYRFLHRFYSLGTEAEAESSCLHGTFVDLTATICSSMCKTYCVLFCVCVWDV